MRKAYIKIACLGFAIGTSNSWLDVSVAQDQPKSDSPTINRTVLQDLIRKYDENRDGRFDDKERENARTAYKKYLAENQTGKTLSAEQKSFLVQFDTNRDEKISDDERKEAKAKLEAMLSDKANLAVGSSKDEFIKKFDMDKDGKLDAEERRAAKEYIEAEEKGLPSGSTFQSDSRVVEFLNKEKLLRDFDQDRNGLLDEVEKKAIREALLKLRAESTK